MLKMIFLLARRIFIRLLLALLPLGLFMSWRRHPFPLQSCWFWFR